MSQEYIPLVIMIVFGFGMASLFMYLSEALGARRVTKEKETTYESGMQPFSNAKDRFSVKYFLVAMLFILFDIEIVFMYPWAVQFRQLGSTAFVAMILFMVLLLSGYIYIIKKGALKWD